jgi:hypothetical protein
MFACPTRMYSNMLVCFPQHILTHSCLCPRTFALKDVSSENDCNLIAPKKRVLTYIHTYIHCVFFCKGWHWRNSKRIYSQQIFPGFFHYLERRVLFRETNEELRLEGTGFIHLCKFKFSVVAHLMSSSSAPHRASVSVEIAYVGTPRPLSIALHYCFLFRYLTWTTAGWLAVRFMTGHCLLLCCVSTTRRSMQCSLHPGSQATRLRQTLESHSLASDLAS